MTVSLNAALRTTLVVAAFGLVTALTGCEKAVTPSAVTADDMAMGPATAKVTVVEYASVACPICASVNQSVMPDLKKKYIVPGKIRYVYRPMLTGVPDVAAAGQLLAQCAGKDKFFTVVDAIMKGQDEFYANGENNTLARPVLLRIAKSVGIDEKGFETCTTDKAALTALQDANDKALHSGIAGTPAFFINGKRFDYRGNGISEFDTAIKAAQDAH